MNERFQLTGWIEAPVYSGELEPFFISHYEVKENLTTSQYPIPNPIHPRNFNRLEAVSLFNLDKNPEFYYAIIESHSLIFTGNDFLKPQTWAFSYTVATDKELKQELKEAQRYLENAGGFWESGQLEIQKRNIRYRQDMLDGKISSYSSKRAKYYDADVPFYKVIKVKPRDQDEWTFELDL